MVKITFEGVVTRIYSEQRGERTNNYIVVSDNAGGKFPNILRFTLKNGAVANCDELDTVRVSAYIDGREWVNAEGKALYFTDLRIDTVDVLAKGVSQAFSAQPASLPTRADSWESLVKLAAAYGEDEAAVTERCKALKTKIGRKFAASDWQQVANEVVASHTPATQAGAAGSFDDDEPF